MPSDKNTRRQRHQAQVKTQPGKAVRGAQSTEFVKKAGYRKSEFIGGKKYYTPMSTDPTSSGAGGDVTNVTISGSSGIGVDNIGVFNVTTVTPVLGGHVTPITGSGVISVQDYDPIGAAASGLSAKGVISSDTVYDGDSPGTFATHFLRKDGVWADVSASLNAFVTWSWVPQSGTPFTTVADSSADAITVTAGAGLEFADTSSGSTDALTLSSTVPNLTVNGAGTVHTNNYTNTTYSVGDGGLTQNNFTNTLKSKLDGIEGSATADQSNTEIKNAVEAASDSNTFTDADHTKLNGIEASADVTDSTNVNAAGAIMHSDIGESDTGFVVRSGSQAYDIDATDYIQTGANTLGDSSGYAGLYHSADASELKFYTIKAGDNITLAKNNAGGQANTYLEISATDAPTANRFTGILDDGVTTYTATSGGSDTLKFSGGTGVNVSAAQSSAVVTVTYTLDIGTGGSQAAAGNHTHSYIATSHAANSITSSHLTILGNTSNTNSGDVCTSNHNSIGYATISGSTGNGVMTFNTGSQLTTESNLTYDAGTLIVNKTGSSDGIIRIEADENNDNESYNPYLIFVQDGNTEESAVYMTSNKLIIANASTSDGGMSFRTTNSNTSYTVATERMLIQDDGDIIPGGNEAYDFGSSAKKWDNIIGKSIKATTFYGGDSYAGLTTTRSFTVTNGDVHNITIKGGIITEWSVLE